MLTAGAASAGLIAFSAGLAHAQQNGWTTAIAPERDANAAQSSSPRPGSGWEVTNVPAAAPGRPPLVLPALKALPRPAFTPATTGALPAKQEPQKAAVPVPAVAAAHPEPAKPAPAATPPAKGDHAPAAAPLAPAVSEPSEPVRAKAADNLRLAQKYCVNIVDAASDARFLLQKKSLTELQQQIDKRIETLEQKAAEYQKWLARRDDFSKKATEHLVKIYTKMSPDSAAAQMAAMDAETAAAILAKLDPRNSSAILNEMPADKAATLTTTISGAAKVKPEPAKVAQPAGAKNS